MGVKWFMLPVHVEQLIHADVTCRREIKQPVPSACWLREVRSRLRTHVTPLELQEPQQQPFPTADSDLDAPATGRTCSALHLRARWGNINRRRRQRCLSTWTTARRRPAGKINECVCGTCLFWCCSEVRVRWRKRALCYGKICTYEYV